jgi:hypothetical protein
LAIATGDGRFLLRTRPQVDLNVTVIEKGPGETVQRIRDPNRGIGRVPARLPEAAPERKLLDGCDPSFSPVAAPSLSHISGRCIADVGHTPKFAAFT